MLKAETEGAQVSFTGRSCVVAELGPPELASSTTKQACSDTPHTALSWVLCKCNGKMFCKNHVNVKVLIICNLFFL